MDNRRSERICKSNDKEIKQQADHNTKVRHFKHIMKIGNNYKISHSRKGEFNIYVTNINSEWITGTIINGTAKYHNRHSDRSVGDEITVRKSLIVYKELNK